MLEQADYSRGTRMLLGAAAVVILVAGMRAASSLLVPFLVAVFLAVMTAPLVFWMRKWGLPSAISVALVVVALVSALSLIGLLVGNSANLFLSRLPMYEARLQTELRDLIHWLGERGFRVSDTALSEYLDPSAAVGLVASIISSVGELLTQTVLIFLTLIFILLEASSFPDKVRVALKRADATLEGFREFALKLYRYVAIKTLFSLLTGILVGIWTAICGLDFPLLWGLLAFLLNYIPNLGSIIAAVPPILITHLQHGLGAAAVVAVGYLVINMTISNLIEVRFMGQGLGLSALVVFVSLITWAWILGPVGMLLSVPLTMTAKIALASDQRTKWISVLLGPEITSRPRSEQPDKKADPGAN